MNDTIHILGLSIEGVTFAAPGAADEIDPRLPDALRAALAQHDGFIVDDGAFHMRGVGASHPSWHRLDGCVVGDGGVFDVYDVLEPGDVAFAQNMLGDQFILRGEAVYFLDAEVGELERVSGTLQAFLGSVNDEGDNLPRYGGRAPLELGDLMHAHPPFCCVTDSGAYSLRPTGADELHRFHAELYIQMRDLPDGAQLSFEIID